MCSAPRCTSHCYRTWTQPLLVDNDDHDHHAGDDHGDVDDDDLDDGADDDRPYWLARLKRTLKVRSRLWESLRPACVKHCQHDDPDDPDDQIKHCQHDDHGDPDDQISLCQASPTWSLWSGWSDPKEVDLLSQTNQAPLFCRRLLGSVKSNLG